jgi:hypothetical protein
MRVITSVCPKTISPSHLPQPTTPTISFLFSVLFPQLIPHAGNAVDEFGNTISNLPENAAAAAGSAVGHVENFGDDIEQSWDNTVDNVENFPENAAHWTGEKVQGVEDGWNDATEGVQEWGQGMEDSYDQGREDARDDDEYDD